MPSVPLSELSVYKWGSRTAEDYFCPTCGVLPFRKPSDLTPEEIEKGAKPFSGWSVNARCLESFDLASVAVESVAGSALHYDT